MALLIDMIILLLLVGTLAYAFLVDRRVRALMAAMQALEPVVDQFSSAVDRTENSVTRASSASASQGTPESAQVFVSTRAAAEAPTQLPPGMARVTGKADLVRSFFDTVRSREA